METLKTLEKKIFSLVDVLMTIKEENARLKKENVQLAEGMEALTMSASKDNGNVKALSEEREQTRMAVDDLIKVIDSLVETQ